MARPRRIDAELVAAAQAVVARTTDITELRSAQAVLLPALARTTLEQTAVALGVSRATVARFQRRFRQAQAAPGAPRPRWGGRRRALLTPEQERAFLAPWATQAGEAGVVVVAPVRAALADHLGRPVRASVVYRLLARHGWRKVAPDTQHPKSDPGAQAEWKKTSRRRWQPC